MIIYQSDQSAKNDHGHGVHSDNRHHDYANESITLFGQTNSKTCQMGKFYKTGRTN